MDASGRWKTGAAACGAVAAVAMGVLSTGVAQGQQIPLPSAKNEATTGATSTETTPGETPQVEEAKPSITGPAALPPEDQGLPG